MKNIIFAFLLMFSINLLASEESPSFTLYDIDGKSIEVLDIKEGLKFVGHDNAVFLIMFGHNCPPCKVEIPILKYLAQNYKGKLSIIALEVQGYSSDELKKFRDEYEINYTLISGKENSNFVGHVAQRAGWKGAIPLLIAIDKKGEVQYLHAGPIKTSKLESLITQLNK
jgi:thiol-disulfide isomerase/thioredoxin